MKNNEYNDLMQPKEVVERNPNLKLNSLAIGWLRNIGLIKGTKKNNVSLVSEKSVLEFHKLNYENNNNDYVDTSLFNNLVEITNTIGYFSNNAKKHHQTLTNGIVINVLTKNNLPNDYEPEDFELEEQIEKLDKIYNHFSNLLIIKTNQSLNNLPNLDTD